MTVVVDLSESLHATATIFPSGEHVDEKHWVGKVPDSKQMAPIGPPVWRSQLISSCPLLNPINKQLSGEKIRPRVYQWGDLKA